MPDLTRTHRGMDSANLPRETGPEMEMPIGLGHSPRRARWRWPLRAAFWGLMVAFFALVGFGILLLSVRILVHLVTLPVEYDASFNKALPILELGGYLSSEDMPAARQVLKAAALTYVAGALVSLLDLARWIRILR